MNSRVVIRLIYISVEVWVIPPREYRFNERIRVPEVRVVDDEGEQLGVMTVQNALEIAGDKGLDLVEVAPQAAPPVCRIMDYGKFRYEATRKEREARKARKSKAIQELREVRMKTRIGQHDLSSKTRLVKRLLGQGAKVKVSVMFRGREITHPELGMDLLKSVAENLVDDALMERPPNFEGRFLVMTLAPNTKKDSNTKKEAPASKSDDVDQVEKELKGAQA